MDRRCLPVDRWGRCRRRARLHPRLYVRRVRPWARHHDPLSHADGAPVLSKPSSSSSATRTSSRWMVFKMMALTNARARPSSCRGPDTSVNAPYPPTSLASVRLTLHATMPLRSLPSSFSQTSNTRPSPTWMRGSSPPLSGRRRSLRASKVARCTSAAQVVHGGSLRPCSCRPLIILLLVRSSP